MRNDCDGGSYPEGQSHTEPGQSNEVKNNGLTDSRPTLGGLRRDLKSDSEKTLSDLALGLVANQRSAEYGPPLINHWRIGQIWSGMLDLESIPPWKVALMMAGLKIARMTETPSDDSLTDAVGYLEIVRQLRP